MKKQLLMVCPLLLIASAAWAVPVCTTATLNVYTNNNLDNYSCTLGGLTFSDFAYNSPSGLPTEASVSVTPVTSAGGDVGFTFDGAFTASAGTSSDAILSYQINASTPMMLGATASLLSYGASGTGASASIVEGMCTTAPSGSGACLPSGNAYSLSVYDNAGHPPVVQTSSVTFSAATSTLYVSKNIVEVGGSGSATISSFMNTVQTGGGAGGPGGGPVPEPASFFTMGSALIGASMLLRNKLKKS